MNRSRGGWVLTPCSKQCALGWPCSPRWIGLRENLFHASDSEEVIINPQQHSHHILLCNHLWPAGGKRGRGGRGFYLAPDLAQGAGLALDGGLGLVGQVSHSGRHHALLGRLEFDLAAEQGGHDRVEGGLGVGKPEHVCCDNGEVDGAEVAGGVAVVEQHIGGGGVDGEGQSEPPVELQGEVAGPHSDHRDHLAGGQPIF